MPRKGRGRHRRFGSGRRRRVRKVNPGEPMCIGLPDMTLPVFNGFPERNPSMLESLSSLTEQYIVPKMVDTIFTSYNPLFERLINKGPKP